MKVRQVRITGTYKRFTAAKRLHRFIRALVFFLTMHCNACSSQTAQITDGDQPPGVGAVIPGTPSPPNDETQDGNFTCLTAECVNGPNYTEDLDLALSDLMLFREIFDTAGYHVARWCIKERDNSRRENPPWALRNGDGAGGTSVNCGTFYGLESSVYPGIQRETVRDDWDEGDTRSLHADGRAGWHDFVAVANQNCEVEADSEEDVEIIEAIKLADYPLASEFTRSAPGVDGGKGENACVAARKLAQFVLDAAYEKADPAAVESNPVFYGVPTSGSIWSELMHPRPGRRSFETIGNSIDFQLLPALLTKFYVSTTPELTGKVMYVGAGSLAPNDLRYIADSCQQSQSSNSLSPYSPKLCRAATWFSDSPSRFHFVDIASNFSLLKRDETITTADVKAYATIPCHLITSLEDKRNQILSSDGRQLLQDLNSSNDTAWQAYVYASRYRFFRNGTADILQAPYRQATEQEYFLWLAGYYAQFQRGAYLTNLSKNRAPSDPRDGMEPAALWTGFLSTIPIVETSGSGPEPASGIVTRPGGGDGNDKKLQMFGRTFFPYQPLNSGNDSLDESKRIETYWAGEFEKNIFGYFSTYHEQSEDRVQALLILSQFQDLFNLSPLLSALATSREANLPSILKTLVDPKHVDYRIYHYGDMNAGLDQYFTWVSSKGDGNIPFEILKRGTYQEARTPAQFLAINLASVAARPPVVRERPWSNFSSFEQDLGNNFFWLRLRLPGLESLADTIVNSLSFSIANFPGVAMMVPGYSCAENLDRFAQGNLSEETGVNGYLAFYHMASTCIADSLAIGQTTQSAVKLTYQTARIANQAQIATQKAVSAAGTALAQTKTGQRVLASSQGVLNSAAFAPVRKFVTETIDATSKGFRSAVYFRYIEIPWLRLTQTAIGGSVARSVQAISELAPAMTNRLNSIASGSIELKGLSGLSEAAAQQRILDLYAETAGLSDAARQAIKALTPKRLSKIDDLIGELQSGYRALADPASVSAWAEIHGLVREMNNVMRFGPKTTSVRLMPTTDHNALILTLRDGVNPGLEGGTTAILTVAGGKELQLWRTGSKAGAAADGEFLASLMESPRLWWRKRVAESSAALPATSEPAVAARISLKVNDGASMQIYSNGLGPQDPEWYRLFDGTIANWRLDGSGGAQQLFYYKQSGYPPNEVLWNFDFDAFVQSGGNLNKIKSFHDDMLKVVAQEAFANRSLFTAQIEAAGTANYLEVQGLAAYFADATLTPSKIANDLSANPLKWVLMRNLMKNHLPNVWTSIGTKSKAVAEAVGLMPSGTSSSSAYDWLQSFVQNPTRASQFERNLMKLSHFVQTSDHGLAHDFHQLQAEEARLWRYLEQKNGGPLATRDDWGLSPQSTWGQNRDLYGSIAAKNGQSANYRRATEDWFQLPGITAPSPTDLYYQQGVWSLSSHFKRVQQQYELAKVRLIGDDAINAAGDIRRLRDVVNNYRRSLGWTDLP